MISSVVPTKFPSTRAVNGAFAGSASTQAPATPRVWFGTIPNRFGRWLPYRTSGVGRTRAAHCADVGSADPGGSRPKRSAAAADPPRSPRPATSTHPTRATTVTVANTTTTTERPAFGNALIELTPRPVGPAAVTVTGPHAAFHQSQGGGGASADPG